MLLLLFCIEMQKKEKNNIIQAIKKIPSYSVLGDILESKFDLLIQKPMKLKPIYKK